MINLEVLVEGYGRAAQGFVNQGIRPAILPCEEAIGEQCSARFLRVMQEKGTVTAVTDLLGRCPQGKPHAVEALGWSTLVAMGYQGGYRRSPRAPGAKRRIDDPCFPGDPCAKDPCA